MKDIIIIKGAHQHNLEKYQRHDLPGRARGDHQGLGLREIEVRFRHAVHRRAAAVCRVALYLVRQFFRLNCLHAYADPSSPLIDGPGTGFSTGAVVNCRNRGH